MYTKKELKALYHAVPELRRTFQGSLNAGNEHITPSALHPNPPKIGDTWADGRYSLADIKQANRQPASEYFFDPLGSVRAYDPRYVDQWFIIDEEEKTDDQGQPIVFEYPFGWSKEDVDVLNEQFFTHPNIMKELNGEFIKRVNVLRKKNGVAPIDQDDNLQKGSLLRTSESTTMNYVHPEHIRPNKESFYTAFSYLEENPKHTIGENQVAIPYNGNIYSILHPIIVWQAVDEWINSPSHLDNLLYEKYTGGYITVQISQRSPWIKNERTAYFTPSVFITCHLSI